MLTATVPPPAQARAAARPRSAAASGPGFPYRLPALCFFEVAADGQVSCGAGPEAVGRAAAGQSRLYAVWPGTWRSDLYEIDDLAAYARATGLAPGPPPGGGLARHAHDVRWAIEKPQPPGSGGYVTLLVRLGCGCQIGRRDLALFAADMLAQHGWDIARTAAGQSRTGSTYRLRVRRNSLTRAAGRNYLPQVIPVHIQVNAGGKHIAARR